MKTIAELINEVGHLPTLSHTRRDTGERVLKETGITNMYQLAVLVEMLGVSLTEKENAPSTDWKERQFHEVAKLSEALRSLHYTMAFEAEQLEEAQSSQTRADER